MKKQKDAQDFFNEFSKIDGVIEYTSDFGVKEYRISNYDFSYSNGHNKILIWEGYSLNLVQLSEILDKLPNDVQKCILYYLHLF